jgi:hypothetical protein
MTHARQSRTLDERPAASTPDRRRFLQVGIALIVLLLAGTMTGRVAWAARSGPAQSTTDPVMDHLSRELIRVYWGMQGVGGVKGEHVRALAANLDLLAAQLQATGDDQRLNEQLGKGVMQSGRDRFAQEVRSRYAGVAAETAGRYGLASRVRLDPGGIMAAVDLMQRDGIVAVLQKARVGLLKLAAVIDRNRGSANTQVLLARQKPGDDFLGYNLFPGPGYSCGDLKFLIHEMGIAAAVFGLCGSALGGGVFALLAEGLSMLYDYGCSPMEAI